MTDAEGGRETGEAIQSNSRDQGGAEGEMAPDRPTNDPEDTADAVQEEEARQQMQQGD